jgi:hypothetical protein
MISPLQYQPTMVHPPSLLTLSLIVAATLRISLVCVKKTWLSAVMAVGLINNFVVLQDLK